MCSSTISVPEGPFGRLSAMGFSGLVRACNCGTTSIREQDGGLTPTLSCCAPDAHPILELSTGSCTLYADRQGRFDRAHAMTSGNLQPVTISIDGGERVSGLLQTPAGARACYVLAHGAGAGMAHPFMASVAEGLAERRVATLRYQFPYMERGSETAGCAQARPGFGSRGGCRGVASGAGSCPRSRAANRSAGA